MERIGDIRSLIRSLFDKTMLKFILVGIVNTLFGTAVMFVAYNVCHWSYWVSSALNYILGSILSFFLNKNFTFGQKGINWKMVGRFVVNIAICYFIAYGVAKPLARWIFSGLSITWQENIAMAAGMCFFVGLNYFGQRFFVFTDQEKDVNV